MGSSSGLIIAFVVVVWAAYFIPLALRRYDDASKNASVETTGKLSRVISRTSRTPAAEASAPAGLQAIDRDALRAEVGEPVARPAAKPVRGIDRPAARLAARRRRRTLLTLLALTVVVAALAGLSVIAPLWVAAPVALVVAWLVACRVQVRGERGVVSTKKPSAKKLSIKKLAIKKLAIKKPSLKKPSIKKPAAKKPSAKKPTVKKLASDEEDTVIVSGQLEDVDPGRKHQMEDVALEANALDDQIVIAVPSMATSGEALWDPLPVTLPTYVTKPRAGRTVRTIDFSQPHTWTSGHIEGEDVELPKRGDDTGDEQRRAVGH